jgi:hypothetical protein
MGCPTTGLRRECLLRNNQGRLTLGEFDPVQNHGDLALSQRVLETTGHEPLYEMLRDNGS